MLTSNDIKKIIIIAALIIFWPEISDFLNPKKKQKKKEEKDMEIDDVSIPEPQVDEICKYIVYEPLSLVGLRGSSLLPKGYCVTGDSYFDDKPHSTGDPYADEQAEEYESKKKSESFTANLDSIAIILNNTGASEITTDVADSTEDSEVWDPIPDAPVALDASDIGTYTFMANWQTSQGATGYYLDVATDTEFTSFVTGFENLDVSNVTEYNVIGLSQYTNYYYRLRAYNNTGTSESSNTITQQTNRREIKYGRLYNFYSISDARGLAPSNYSVASYAQHNTLYTNLGGIAVAGGILKSTRTDPDSHPRWDSPNTGAVDTYGFACLPGGYRNNNGVFENLGKIGRIYTSFSGWGSVFAYNSNAITRTSYIQTHGHSIRMIRDNTTGWTEDEKVIDEDGNVYDTIKIGDQVWVVQNWACTKYANGDDIPNVTDTTEWSGLSEGAYCNYDNDEDYVFET
jgi:uncharacterized protein (TIGR02145 family)